MNVKIYPPADTLDATVKLPYSKSISNRALIMNALTPGSKHLENVAACYDTDLLKLALIVRLDRQQEINIGSAGTAMRFLTAYFAAIEGSNIILDGSDRMRERPIGVLVDALRQCGADIEYLGKEGFPPLVIHGKRLNGGEITIDASISSQFASAILMAAPTFTSPLTLNLDGDIASLPYLDMTIAMMENRGITVERYRNVVTVEPGTYQPDNEEIERDWSAASYWYEISAMTAGWITLEDMKEHSVQGDAKERNIFDKIGAVTEFEDGNALISPSPDVYSRFEIDLTDYPDLVPAMAVTCCFLSIPFKFTGLKSLRIKECDRLEALKQELAKFSFLLEITRDDCLEWNNRRVPVMTIPPIETHDDHRIAMAFAPISYFYPGITIKNAEVVNKSYPGFWDDLRKVGFKVL